MISQKLPFATNAGQRRAVRFVRSWQSYFRGDTASFPARMATRLVERGIAEAVDIAPPDQMPPEGCEWALRSPNEPPLRQRGGDADILDL